MEQRSPEWHQARKNRITASIVGAILGHSPYMSRWDAMRLMVRESLGAEREFQGNPATEYGTFHEDGAIAEFCMETGHKVEKIGFVQYEDWAGASPDGFTSDGGGIETKCPYGLRNASAPVLFKPLADQPHYYDQVQFTLAVTGRPHWWFWQWAPNGTDLESVLPDLDWQDGYMPILRQFYAEFLDELANNADEHLAPQRVEIDTPEATMLVDEWDQLTEAIENATERKKELLGDAVAMAGNKNALIAGRKLTLTRRAGAISYAKAIKELCPNADLEKWRGKTSEFWGLK